MKPGEEVKEVGNSWLSGLCSALTGLYAGACDLAQAYDQAERIVHAREMQAFYRDGAPLEQHSALSGNWWRERFVWQRTLDHMPHCVIFVFRGTEEPFFSGERRAFFTKVFADCKKMGELSVTVT